MPYDIASTAIVGAVCLVVLPPTPAVMAQTQNIEEYAPETGPIGETDTPKPFKQARYTGRPILVHLPTNAARALVMPEPVTLQGDPEQLPGVELAYEGEVIGFYATQSFNRRKVTFIGAQSGIEYLLQIRASENGIVEPLEINR